MVFGLGCFSARADLEVSAGISIHASADFYAPLTPSGAWIDVGTYGRCWRPAGVALDWRPYCEGSWEWTDNGWYWQTDEPFGWACYHYGSWVYDPVRYWVWVPGVEWAPAWVSWRHGGGYVGWAPLGPNHVVVEGPQFTFVAEGHFHEPIHRAAVVVNNTTIINKTVVINNVHQESRGSAKVVINEGPGLATMQKATGNKIKTVSITTAVQRTTAPKEVRRTTVENKTETKPTVTREPARPEPARVEPRTEPAKVIAPNRDRIATEPPVEKAPVLTREPREEIKRETKPAVVERPNAEEKTERVVKPENPKRVAPRPVLKRPVAPVHPPVEQEEKKPEKP